jgi:hypothetical protein
MGKKILGILVCMLFILTTVSTVAARQERTVYKNCYIEVEVEGEGLYNMVKYVFLRPTGDNSASVLCWILQWMGPEYGTVKIFDQKNGNELWNNQNQEGIWATKLFFYNGLYTWSTENGHSVLNLQGTSKATVVLYDG